MHDIHSFLDTTDFTDLQNYSKNTHQVLHVVKGLETHDKAYIEALLPKISHALQTLRATQSKIENKHEAMAGKKMANAIAQHVNALAKQNGIDFRIQDVGSQRFRKVAKDLKVLGTGSTVPGANPLTGLYYLETIGVHLEIDGKPFDGQIYMAHFSSRAPSDWMKQWREEKDTDGVRYQEKYSFEEFMNQKIIPEMTPDEREALKKACQDVVEYYTADELKTTQAQVVNGKIVIPAVLGEWFGKKNPQESYRTYLKHCSEALFEKKPVLATVSERVMYVLTTDGKLQIQQKQRGTANHTSISGGHAVLAAGHMLVKNGLIQSLEGLSGHYRPSKVQMVAFLEFLKKQGVDIDAIDTVSFAEIQFDDVPATMQEIHKGSQSAWIQAEKDKLLLRLKELDAKLYANAVAQKTSYARLLVVVKGLTNI